MVNRISARWEVKMYKFSVFYAGVFTSLINHYGDLDSKMIPFCGGSI